ncbi:MAG: 3-dehydroquinate synthase [Candidatus Omnitrophota bacterium]|jgi:3-dehydroquinate synthase
MAKIVNIALRERSYDVHIGSGTHNQLPHLIQKNNLHGTAVIVSQKCIWKHWGKIIEALLLQAGVKSVRYVVSSGNNSEAMKSIKHLSKLLNVCAKASKAGNGVFIIALGGGVVGDLAGLAASVYKRGTPYIQIPTTLTGQVDSAIGGKTAVDLKSGKNLVGTIYQPSFVLVDPLFLSTLPNIYYADGLAEVIKYAIIKSKPLFRLLETNVKKILNKDAVILEDIIRQCIEIKSAFVSRDERDQKGIRALLNFGHTFGHALEAGSGYGKYTHGKAVAIGMATACNMSMSLASIQNKTVPSSICKLITDYGLPTRIVGRVNANAVVAASKLDKKWTAGRNQFILLKDIGRAYVHADVPEEMVQKTFFGMCGKEVPKGRGPSWWRLLFANKGKGKAKSTPRTYVRPSKPRPAPRTRNAAAKKATTSTKRPVKPRVAKPKTPVAPAVEIDDSKLGAYIGFVEAFYANISVAIIKVEEHELAKGNNILISGPRGKTKFLVKSMQIDRKPIELAKPGDIVGLRVPRRCGRGDKIHIL